MFANQKWIHKNFMNVRWKIENLQSTYMVLCPAHKCAYWNSTLTGRIVLMENIFLIEMICIFWRAPESHHQFMKYLLFFFWKILYENKINKLLTKLKWIQNCWYFYENNITYIRSQITMYSYIVWEKINFDVWNKSKTVCCSIWLLW